ncbi:endonuclease SmrB [Pseudoalteromonas sp. MMG024]|uniref:endonuclease SmrB n=1 Tax=Pseudoalteromonas sp. MMG024 TaxID=2909980 RepID=UPI001F404C5B|nr:endonuclease SmrB [Pseudoalteromonas sp. MMG024]MCF6457076.1 endonuclease SmrB [Pseudoalteromonas sp. MMG024]
MKKDHSLSDDDIALFRSEMSGSKKISQDTVHFKKAQKAPEQTTNTKVKQLDAEFYFSDEYIPDIDTSGTVNFVKPGADSYLAKQLRRGDFAPELILDMHGMNKETAKLELASLISACKKRHLRCACIVTGVGERVLKHKVPHYLVQHPDVLAIHQAPLEYGGRGALLILVDIPEDPFFR